MLFRSIETTLLTFNSTTALRSVSELTRKIEVLDAKLATFGLGKIPRYSASEARRRRQRNLLGMDGIPLNPALFPNAILETP